MEAVAYYDSRYPDAWISGETYLRDYLQKRGFTVKDADALKTWMDAGIAKGDARGAVCVFCQDAVPDTVVESMLPTATVRKFLELGGGVVYVSNWPFYWQGHNDGTYTEWGPVGCRYVLAGFTLQFNDDGQPCTITDEGYRWGLRKTWNSQRAIESGFTPHIVLAKSTGGYPAAWVYFFHPDGVGGFVRIHDRVINYQGDDALCQEVHDVAIALRRRASARVVLAGSP